MQKRGSWEEVGAVAVDSGTLWVGDPCYVLPDDASHNPGGDWEKFVEQLCIESGHPPATKLWGNSHGSALGISISQFGGDGAYPVCIQRNRQGLVVAVRVDFDPEPTD